MTPSAISQSSNFKAFISWIFERKRFSHFPITLKQIVPPLLSTPIKWNPEHAFMNVFMTSWKVHSFSITFRKMNLNKNELWKTKPGENEKINEDEFQLEVLTLLLSSYVILTFRKLPFLWSDLSLNEELYNRTERTQIGQTNKIEHTYDDLDLIYTSYVRLIWLWVHWIVFSHPNLQIRQTFSNDLWWVVIL